MSFKCIVVIFVILSIIVLGFLLFSIIYLAIINWGSEAIRSKITTAIAVGIVGTFSAIWFILSSQPIEDNVYSTLIINNNDKKLLNVSQEKSVPNRFYTLNNLQWRLLDFANLIIDNNDSWKNKKVNDSSLNREISEFYLDVFFTGIIYDFLQIHGDSWIVDIRKCPEAGVHSTEVKHKNLPQEVISWPDFVRNIKNVKMLEDFISQVSTVEYNQVALPPQTVISGGSDNSRRMLILKNDFAEVSIEVDFRTGSNSLGEYRLLLGREEQNKDFFSMTYLVTLKAKFNRFRSGNTMMANYKHWVNTIFDRIKTEFDSDKHLEQNRKYYLLYGKCNDRNE